MVRPVHVPLSNRTRRFALSVRLGDEDFTFELCGRRFALGPSRSVPRPSLDAHRLAPRNSAAASSPALMATAIMVRP